MGTPVWVVGEMIEDDDERPNLYLFRSREAAIKCFESQLEEYCYDYTTLESLMEAEDEELNFYVDSHDEDWENLMYENLFICKEYLK